MADQVESGATVRRRDEARRAELMASIAAGELDVKNKVELFSDTYYPE